MKNDADFFPFFLTSREAEEKEWMENERCDGIYLAMHELGRRHLELQLEQT